MSVGFVPSGESPAALEEALLKWQRGYVTDTTLLIEALNDIAMRHCEDPQARAREALDTLLGRTT